MPFQTKLRSFVSIGFDETKVGFHNIFATFQFFSGTRRRLARRSLFVIVMFDVVLGRRLRLFVKDMIDLRCGSPALRVTDFVIESRRPSRAESRLALLCSLSLQA